MIMPIFTALLLCLGGYALGEQVVADEVRAIIYHDAGSELVTLSDLARPLLGGGVATIKDKVLEELMLLDAKKLGLVITREDAEDFMAKLQQNRGVSRLEMMRMFEEFGYTFDEGLEALRRRQIVEQIVDFRVRSDKRMVVQKEEMLDFIEKNPQYSEPVFILTQAIVEPAKDGEEKTFTQKELQSFSWEEQFEVRASELPEEKQFLHDAVIGSVVGQELTDEGLEITRLVEKRDAQLISAEERMDEAAMTLGQERFFSVMGEYQKMLLDQALIRFTYDSDKVSVFGE